MSITKISPTGPLTPLSICTWFLKSQNYELDFGTWFSNRLFSGYTGSNNKVKKVSLKIIWWTKDLKIQMQMDKKLDSQD